MPNERTFEIDVPIASEEDSRESTGELIRTYRRNAGLTQLQVAKAMGLSENTICRYEKGLRRVPHDTFMKILLYCNSRVPPEARIPVMTNKDYLPDLPNLEWTEEESKKAVSEAHQRRISWSWIDKYLDKLSDENLFIVATIVKALAQLQGEMYATDETDTE